MGRLSNPAEPLETPVGQGLQSPRRRQNIRARRPRQAPAASETAPQETTGRLSNPRSRPIQRRLNATDIADLVAGYRAGQTLSDLATQFCIHHRTVATHLEQCGVRRRMNTRKLTNDDIEEAALVTEVGNHSPQ